MVNGLRGSAVRFIGDTPLVQFDNGEVQLIIQLRVQLKRSLR
jgi:hypothetical protein